MKLTIKFIALFLIVYQLENVYGISRSEVIQRARSWIGKRVGYSMSAYNKDPQGKNYRTDCSGYVSMAWRLGSSLVTGTLPNVSKRITKDQLRAGDILIKAGVGGDGHTLIFDKWANPQKTRYWTYEQHGPAGTPTDYRTVAYPYNGDNRYVPYRYNQITD